MKVYRVDTPDYWALIRAKSQDQARAYYLRYFAASAIVCKATPSDINEYRARGLTVKSLSETWDPNDEAQQEQDRRAAEIESGLS